MYLRKLNRVTSVAPRLPGLEKQTVAMVPFLDIIDYESIMILLAGKCPQVKM
jgi:hypothetical protein